MYGRGALLVVREECVDGELATAGEFHGSGTPASKFEG